MGPARSLIAVVVLIAAVGVISFVALVWATQRDLLYFPERGAVPPAASALPGSSDVELLTEDGVRLGGWLVPPSTPATGVTVLVCNGNGGDRALRAGLARGLASAGHRVLLFDYRGYGGNAGTPTEMGLRADARAALAYLRSRPDIDPARIVYFGESLGAAVAAQLAAEHPPLALVLRSPFTTLADVGRIHYPYLPVIDPLLMDRYRTVDAVAEVSAPVLVVAGDRDRVVPIELSRNLYAAARDPKRLVIVGGADHNDPPLAEGPSLVGELTGFVVDALRGRFLPASR